MKNIHLYLIMALFIISSVSCDKYVQGYDISPNDATVATMPLLLASAELGLQSSYTGGPVREASIFIQQIAGTDQQMADLAGYSLTETDNENDWNTIYTVVVQTSNNILEKSKTEDLYFVPYYVGIAKVLKAMALGLATDCWGDVPASEAGRSLIDENLQPKYDTQKDVIVYVQQLLGSALTDFASTEDQKGKILPGKDDFMLKGDIAKWINVIKILQARYANRLSNIDPQGSATSALNYLADVEDIGNLDAVYGANTSEINQWFAFENQRLGYIKTGAFLVKLLTANDDPRLPFYVAENDSGLYVGSSANTDSTNSDASPIGTYIASEKAPIPMVTYTEALFIKAEANLRLNNLPDAAAAYDSAVLMSVRNVTGKEVPPAFVIAYASETGATITLEKIMVQKYLSSFINMEAWTDWRRTGFPELLPNAAGAVDGIPRRFPTILGERVNNHNAVVENDVLKPVWWDTYTKK